MATRTFLLPFPLFFLLILASPSSSFWLLPLFSNQMNYSFQLLILASSPFLLFSIQIESSLEQIARYLVACPPVAHTPWPNPQAGYPGIRTFLPPLPSLGAVFSGSVGVKVGQITIFVRLPMPSFNFTFLALPFSSFIFQKNRTGAPHRLRLLILSYLLA